MESCASHRSGPFLQSQSASTLKATKSKVNHFFRSLLWPLRRVGNFTAAAVFPALSVMGRRNLAGIPGWATTSSALVGAFSGFSQDMWKYKRMGERRPLLGQVKCKVGLGVGAHPKTVQVISLVLFRYPRGGVSAGCSGWSWRSMRSRAAASSCGLPLSGRGQGPRWCWPAFAHREHKPPAHTKSPNALTDETWRAECIVRLTSTQAALRGSF